MKILVIDDEQATQELLKLSLEAEGHDVLIEADTAKAFDVFGRERPDIVFAGVEMPDMDGMGTLKRISALHGSSEIVVMTGRAEPALILEALRMGAVDFIEKPIREGALAAALQSAKKKLWMRSTLMEYTTLLERKVHDVIKELERRHELEYELVHASIDGIIVNDRKGSVVVFNEGSERIYGYRAAEVIGRINVVDLYPPGEARRVRQLMLGHDHGPPGELTNYETVVLAKDGTHVPVLLSGRPIYEGGEEVAAVGYFKDMREVKGLLQEMAELVQASIDGIIVNDPKGNVIVFNEGSERIYGYKMEEVVGRINVRDLYPPGLAKEVKRKILSEDWGPPGELTNYETVVLAKDGSRVPVLLSARTLAKGGGAVHAVGYFKDMREIKKLQEELLESERMVAMGHTVASIAHGIKNILHSMNLGAYLLDMGLNKDDSKILTKGWSLVKNNIQRVSKLALDMLSFSQDREPSLRPSDPNEVMDRVIELYRDRAGSKNIEVVCDYGTFPEDVFMDPDAIENCLVNLVTNAIEAFQEGCEGPCITLATRQVEPAAGGPPDAPEEAAPSESGTIELEVRDNAGGISQDAKQYIFKEIYSTKGAKGTGLGLYITKKCVEEHGGTIDWSTEKGVGTVFTIKLPRYPQKR